MIYPDPTLKISYKQIFLVIIIPIILLIPFIAKAFHIDDTVFLWTAKQILSHPADFSGFSVNWYGYEMPMYMINKNPPLVSYYIAVIAHLIGWNEIIFHLAMIIPAVFVSLGTYFLSLPFCTRPHLAAFIAVLTPGFLVSSTNVMSDVMMLAFYVWAIVFWVSGLEKNSRSRLMIASVLISLSALTKYFGITLLPLLFVYSLAARRRPGQRILFLMIPFLILTEYEWVTYSVYGQGLLTSAASYAVETGQHERAMFLFKILTALAFSGGCFASVACYIPWLWSKKIQMAGVIFPVLLGTVLLYMGKLGTVEFHAGDSSVRWGLLIQSSLFIAAGIHIFVLALTDLLRHKDNFSLLLFLWVSGTLFFAIFVNWTISARTVLPMAPAVGILVSRRYGVRTDTAQYSSLSSPFLPLTFAALIALAVTWADFSLAECERLAARYVQSEFDKYPHTIWFQGHWGFQYYMESVGARALDFKNSVLQQGDIIIVPSNNSNVRQLSGNIFHLLKTEQLYSCRWLATMAPSSGAGFYADVFGPLPFVFDTVKPNEYNFFMVDP